MLRMDIGFLFGLTSALVAGLHRMHVLWAFGTSQARIEVQYRLGM